MLSNYSKRSFIFYSTGNVEDKHRQGKLQYMIRYTLKFSNLSSAALEYLKSFSLMVYRCAVTLLFIHFVDCGWGEVVFGSNRMY